MSIPRFLFPLLCVAALSGAFSAEGQAPPQPDLLILTNGETLRGHFVGSKGGSVTFHHGLLGDLSTAWTNIRELQVHGRYAVLAKNLVAGPGINVSQVPIGQIHMVEKTLTVDSGTGAPSRMFAVADVAQIIDEQTFEKQIRQPNLLQAWKGAVTAGASLVVATQQSRTFTGSLTLTRSIPAESNLPPRSRTILNISGSDGFLLQPGSPKLKTEILHGDAERDQYLRASRVFAFGQVAFDHNFSQGLNLQQNYGGGIGWTVTKTANETMDVKGSLSFLAQRFQDAAQNQSLVASTLAQNFTHKFDHGITVLEQFSVTPTWNNLHAWLSSANASLTIPVNGRLAFTISAADSFLNEPSPGFRKNSFQATTGLTFTLK